jgi:hypothetical protein
MRRSVSLAILTTVSALTVVGSISSAPAAEPMQDSYCLQGRSSGYPGNCQFSSYQQCMATASGTDEGCGVNPMKAFPQRHGGYQSRY